MPAYTHLRTFIDALKSGETHITERLDWHFSDLNRVRNHPHYDDFISGDWSEELPDWLGEFLDGIGLKPEERDHVLEWPPAEVEKARAKAAARVQANDIVKFRWELYHGNDPVTDPAPSGDFDVLFRSPGRSLRLTDFNYGEVYVEEVPKRHRP